MLIQLNDAIYEIEAVSVDELTRDQVLNQGLLVAIREGEKIFHIKDRLVVPEPEVQRNLDDVSGLMDIETLLSIVKSHSSANDFIRSHVNMTNQHGNTVLFEASGIMGSELAVRNAIDLGAEVNHKNNAGNTPLMVAARYGKMEAAVVLMENGADLHVKNDKGQTALDIASQSSQKNVIAAIENVVMKMAIAGELNKQPKDVSGKNKRAGRL